LAADLVDLALYLTERCDFDCTYCYVHRGHGAARLESETVLRAVEAFLRTGPRPKGITLVGGEPLIEAALLREVVPRIQRMAADGGRPLTVTLFTNALRLRPPIHAFLDDHGVKVVISLDGPREVHDRHRRFLPPRRGSTYDAVLSAIEGIPRRDLAISGVFYAAEAAGLVDNVEHLLRLGFRSINFYPEVYARWDDRAFACLEESYRRFSGFVADAYLRRSLPLHLNWVLYFAQAQHRNTAMRCGRLLVGPDGRYYPCKAVISLPPELRESYCIGDVSTGVDWERRTAFLSAARRGVETAIGSGIEGTTFCPYNIHTYHSALGEDPTGPLREFRRIALFFADTFRSLIARMRNDPLFERVHHLEQDIPFQEMGPEI
jgi:sulfatase maturation enzyme AslB (radical SAM superfamily)